MDTSPQGELTVSQAWALVREAPVGRLAVVVDGRPQIFPVNHVVDHGTVVFRTAAGSKLDAAVGHRVAYEVDGLDAVTGEAWSVVVAGTAHEVVRLHELVDAWGLALFPWQQGPKPRLVRIDADEVTGRRFVPVALPPRDAPRPG